MKAALPALSGAAAKVVLQSLLLQPAKYEYNFARSTAEAQNGFAESTG
jgi:hypothetical protein